MWGKEIEKKFFIESLKNYSTPEQLFYITDDNRYLAYWIGRKVTKISKTQYVIINT